MHTVDLLEALNERLAELETIKQATLDFLALLNTKSTIYVMPKNKQGRIASKGNYCTLAESMQIQSALENLRQLTQGK